MKKVDARKDELKKREKISSFASGVGRRDLMKIGAGAVLSTLGSRAGSAQNGQYQGSAEVVGKHTELEGVVRATPGWKNDANRVNGNGPMDDTSRQLAEYTHNFSESQLTPPILTAMGTYMIDTLAAWISGFETEQGRIGARLGKMTQCEMKSTIFGYGIVTAPQIAAMTNAAMTRHKDFNDKGPGAHPSVNVPGIIAVGEAMHSTGPQVLAAIAMAIEVIYGLQSAERHGGVSTHWDNMYNGVASALAAGKLMGLDEDRLANALSMAIVPHVPLNTSHVGHLSHYKSMHQAIQVHDGVWAAMMAKEGMTGPSAPFESRGGLWDSVTGPYKELKLPVSSKALTISDMQYKRFPSDGDHQSLLSTGIPELRKMVKAEDIAAIDFEIPWGHWQENADPPKWDPHNSETADHSLPYCVAVALVRGDLYLDDYKPERFLHDREVRDLMQKITTRGNSSFGFDQVRITVTKKSGETFVHDIDGYKNLDHDEVVGKYKRVCAYIGVKDEQRDKAFETFSNLQKLNDIGDAVKVMAHYGNPRPLTEQP